MTAAAAAAAVAAAAAAADAAAAAVDDHSNITYYTVFSKSQQKSIRHFSPNDPALFPHITISY